MAKKKKDLSYIEFIATFILPSCIMVLQEIGGKKEDEEKNICHFDGDANECDHVCWDFGDNRSNLSYGDCSRRFRNSASAYG